MICVNVTKLRKLQGTMSDEKFAKKLNISRKHLSKVRLCKCQYKNVVFLSYKHVGKPTCLYDIF